MKQLIWIFNNIQFTATCPYGLQTEIYSHKHFSKLPLVLGRRPPPSFYISFIWCIYSQNNRHVLLLGHLFSSVICLLFHVLFLMSEGNSSQYGLAGKTSLCGTSGWQFFVSSARPSMLPFKGVVDCSTTDPSFIDWFLLRIRTRPNA